LSKLDIAKAFDNVCWKYLLEVMQQLGFGQMAGRGMAVMGINDI